MGGVQAASLTLKVSGRSELQVKREVGSTMSKQSTASKTRVADLLIDCLVAQGTDRIFCTPGESFLGALDALRDRSDIETVIVRHENSGGFMCHADAKLTGRPGVLYVSRSPGMLNGALTIEQASREGTPMVVLIGHVHRDEMGRRAFQELDYAKTFSDCAKDVWLVEDGARLPQAIARAYSVACAPTPGPVILVLPEDMLSDEVEAEPVGPFNTPRASGPGSAEDLDRVHAMIEGAEKPVLVFGGAVGCERGRAATLAFAEAHAMPVLATYLRQDQFPNTNRLFAGHLGFKIAKADVDRYSEADLVIAVGTRLTEVSTQRYTFPLSPKPLQPLVHVTDDAQHISREYQTDVAIVANPIAFLEALASRPSVKPDEREAWIDFLHAPIEANLNWQLPEDGRMDLGVIINALSKQLDDNAAFVLDAGIFSSWMHRHFPFNGRQRIIGPVAGAMGFGMPAAIACGLREPSRQFITLIGDGGMTMNGAELITAVQYGAPVKVIVGNNGVYGSIRLHQERAYPGRDHGTELRAPDFPAWAESFSAKGIRITKPEEVAAGVAEFLACDGPVVMEVKTDPHHISAFATLDDVRN